MFCLLLSNSWHSIRTSSKPPRASRLGVDMKWEGDITRAADLNWPKWLIFYTIWHHTQKVGKEKERGEGFTMKMSVFWNNQYTYWSPASQDVDEHCSLMGGREYFFFSLCASAQPLLFFFFSLFLFLLIKLSNYLYHEPWSFYLFKTAYFVCFSMCNLSSWDSSED